MLTATCLLHSRCCNGVVLQPATRWHSIFSLCSCSRGGVALNSVTGAYIHMRHCNPILNLLCTANLVPPVLLVDEESFCHRVVSIITRSRLKKDQSWWPLLQQTTDESVFFRSVTDWDALLLCFPFVKDLVCVTESGRAWHSCCSLRPECTMQE